MARSIKDPYYAGAVKVSVGGVPCRMASKPGKAYAAMLKGDRLGYVKMARREFNASYAMHLLDLWGIEVTRETKIEEAFWLEFHARYPEWNGGEATEVVADEPDMFADEVEPDLVAIRQARALEIDEAAETSDERPVVEFGAIERVEDEVAPLDRVLSFADFVDECGKAYGDVQAELVDERPIVEFGAIEPVPVEEPVEQPRLTVADLRRLIDERPVRSRPVPPADMVPVEPFQPREPVVIDWLARSAAIREARRAPARPAPVAGRPLVASDLF